MNHAIDTDFSGVVMRYGKHVILVFMVTCLSGLPLLAFEKTLSLSDREIVERLTRVEEKLNSIDQRFDAIDKRFDALDKRFDAIDKRFDAIDKRFEMMDKRFEVMDKRFEAMDKRFEVMQNDMNQRFGAMQNDMNQRFDQLVNLMLGMMATFGGIVAVAIGFAVWDRRTMIRPFEIQVAQIKTELKKQETELSSNRQLLHNLLEAFRALAKTDIRVAEILRTFSLL